MTHFPYTCMYCVITLPCAPVCTPQFARDFYIGQWLYDIQLDLEKALKDNPQSPTAQIDDLNVLDDCDASVKVSSSAVVLQQSESKKDMILTLLDPKYSSVLKTMEGILDERTSAVVTRYLASSRALSRSFDMYLQKVNVIQYVILFIFFTSLPRTTSTAH